MSFLQIKMSFEEEDASFIVYECTGQYSADNKTGYSGPNLKKENIIQSTLEIQGPSDEGYDHVINVTGALPASSEDIGLEITPSMIGQTDYIESGRYKFKLSHIFETRTGATVTKTGYGIAVFKNNIKCCVGKLKYDPSKPFHDLKQQKIVELKTLYFGVEEQICQGHYDTANTTIDYLKAQCKCNGC